MITEGEEQKHLNLGSNWGEILSIEKSSFERYLNSNPFLAQHMRQNLPEEHKVLYDKVKWHLWHGRPVTALIRLEQLKALIDDDSALLKLNKLALYISNNKEGIVSYEARKRNGLVYTSNLAEGTVNNLINERQKGKQKMLWGREGAHNVLQIRSSVESKSWKTDWKKVESELYKMAA